MQIGEREGIALPATSLLLLAAALAGTWLHARPLRSFRPAHGEARREAVPGSENVPARLWQDPLGAVRAHRGLHSDADGNELDDRGEHCFADLTDRLREECSAEDEALLLAVLVPGGDLAEDVETRLRTRYAVVSALGASGFQPRSRDRIGYFATCWTETGVMHEREQPAGDAAPAAWRAAGCDASCTEVDLPFEWFDPDPLGRVGASGADGVGRAGRERTYGALVLWLDERHFARKPLSRVSRILEELERGGSTGEPSPRYFLRLIGPSNSNGLVEMMRDVSAPEVPLEADVRVLNCRATAPEPLLFARLDPTGALENRRGETVAGLFERGGVRYERLLCTDEVLARELLHELGLRGVFEGRRGCDHEPLGRIALVTEFDTYYGRSMPITFESVLAHLATDHPDRDDALDALHDCIGRCGTWDLMGPALLELTSEERPRPENPWIELVRVDYLRGLDGSAPGSIVAGSAGGIPEQAMEVPTGASQLDYVRRQVARLELEGEDELRAIGVLGSDLYDKQLVLQASRKAYPGLPFFTTDLDARLAHPSQYGWSRNLIVASGHGLALEAAEQGSIPPFRNAYQTAAFAATRRALGFGPAQPTPGPRVFEIARSGAHELAPRCTGGSSATAAAAAGGEWAWAVPLAGLLMLLLYAGSSTGAAAAVPLWRALPDRGLRAAVGVLAALAVTAWVALPLVGGDLRELPDSEPMLFLEGISVWPTEGVRLVAALVCIGGVIAGAARLAVDDREVEASFGLRPPPETAGILRGLAWSLGIGRTAATGEDGRVDAQEAWARYRANARLGPTVLRIVLLVAVYLGLAFLLFDVLGRPHVPARGELARSVDRKVLFLGVAAITVLLFFVIDATRECTRFVDSLSLHPSRWPAPRDPRLVERGLQEEDRAHLTDVLVVARRTRIVGNLILLPFFGLLLMILSRLSWFDGWDWPPSLVLVFGIQAALALGAAVRLRRAAERARQRATERLTATLVRLRGEEKEAGAGRARQLETVLAEIRDLREGAFAPWSQRPVLRALLMPFSGIGAVALLDAWARSGS